MKKPSKFDRTQDELVKSLHALRLVTKEVGSNYIAGLQADVARLETAVRQAREDDMPDRKQLQQLTTMLRWVTDLNVKPQKGRRRDLKEIDKLIERLNNVVENW
jgi:hypothetical protein